MNPLFFIVPLVVLIGGIVVISVIVSNKMEKQRTDQLSRIAEEMGFSFEPDGAAVLTTGLSGLPVFNKGHSKKTKNVMTKMVRETEVTLLDHYYTVGSGKHAQHYRHTVAIFHGDEDACFPEFQMQPENFFHKIGSLFGYQDIDFDSHPKFSKRYLIRGSNEDAIRATFSQTVLDFFEQHPGKWLVESRANWVAAYNPSRAKPDAIRQFLADTTKVFLLFAPQSTSNFDN